MNILIKLFLKSNSNKRFFLNFISVYKEFVYLSKLFAQINCLDNFNFFTFNEKKKKPFFINFFFFHNTKCLIFF